MSNSNQLVLHEDAQLMALVDVPTRVRERLPSSGGSHVLSRPGTRYGSMVLDEQGAHLVRLLAGGTLLTDALKQLAVESNIPASDLVREAYPLIETLVKKQYLKKKDAPSEEPRPSGARTRFQRNDIFRGHTILQVIQVLEDTEVYKISLKQGGCGALKLIRKPGSIINEAFKRESFILQRLKGNLTPAIIEPVTGPSEDFIIMDWIDGVQSHDWAARVRNLAPKPRHAEMLRLMTNVLEAYANLHAQGVIHSDVYSNNLIVRPDGSVCIVDFGFSWDKEANRELGAAPRNNNPYFKAPDMARAELATPRQIPLPPNVASEIYSLGALLYFFASGHTYVDFSVEGTTLLQQICDAPMVPLVERGFPEWGSLDPILSAMLAKDASQRPASIAECLAALRDIPSLTDTPKKSAPILTLQDTPMLRSFANCIEIPKPPAPSASINYGAAGIAFALLKAAHVFNERTLAPEADNWAAHARLWMDAGPDGSFLVPLGVTKELTDPYAILHRSEGVALIEALVAHSSLNTNSLRSACERFLGGIHLEAAPLEFILGKAGLLNTIQQLSYLVIDNQPLRRVGTELAAAMIKEIGSYPSMEESPIQFVGFGHGWAGILYSLLAWGREYNPSLVTEVLPLLTELAAYRTTTRCGAFWPKRFDRPTREGDVSSWCNGTAGLTLLWSEAFSTTKDPQWLKVAREAATHTLSHHDTSITLCCGLAGRAYALATLFAVSGEEEWLAAAHDCLERAKPEPCHVGGFPHSLFKGYVGLELAKLEIQKPEAIVFPTLASKMYGEPLPADPLRTRWEASK
jgi:serine/threonine protein kinase